MKNTILHLKTRVILVQISLRFELESLEHPGSDLVFHISSSYIGVPLSIEKGDFSWQAVDGYPILRNINVEINSGSLVAVVGPVGSGKSSLISAFLGEMYKLSGSVNTNVSTCALFKKSQFSRLLRFNINFL